MSGLFCDAEEPFENALNNNFVRGKYFRSCSILLGVFFFSFRWDLQICSWVSAFGKIMFNHFSYHRWYSSPEKMIPQFQADDTPRRLYLSPKKMISQSQGDGILVPRRYLRRKEMIPRSQGYDTSIPTKWYLSSNEMISQLQRNDTLVPRIWYISSKEMIPQFQGDDTSVPRRWYLSINDIYLSINDMTPQSYLSND